MRNKYSACIIGNGRIASAVAHYLRHDANFSRVDIFASPADAAKSDILIGALPGELGAMGLDLALRYQKPLLDISDLDPDFYLKKKKDINKSGITVIPGCGFCPGLVNFILGREISVLKDVSRIEVKAGSLSPKPFYYPFLWCFEDLVLEHRIPSWQIINGKKKKFGPFAGYQEERCCGIHAESYYSASGFENILDQVKVKTFVCRVVRPIGFMHFFYFLENEGLLDKEHMMATKSIVESKKELNISLAEVTVANNHASVSWFMSASAKSKDTLNSMQKITAVVPAVIAGKLLSGAITPKGVVFMEQLAADRDVFNTVIDEIMRKGIEMRRRRNTDD